MKRSLTWVVGIFASTFLVTSVGAAAPLTADSARNGSDSGEPKNHSECGTDDLVAGKLPVEHSGTSGSLSLITDRDIGEEGIEWSSPIAVAFSSPSAFLTYDLGMPRTVGAIYVQADGDSTFRVLGSEDGTPGSFRVLATVEAAFVRGHGLRYRAIQAVPSSVRFLRIGEATGDGRSSISELAVYCQPPATLPFTVSTAAGPSAKARQPDPEVALPQESGPSTPLLFLAAAASVLAVGGLFLGRRRSRQKPPASKRRASSKVASETTASVATADALREWSLRCLFAASGCAALIYEVVWLHLLRLVIGASALSVGIVLAAFMGGMFLGSLLFARYVRAHHHPLRVYGLIELGIGLFGLLIPLVLPAVRFIYVGLVGYGPLGIALRAVIAAVLLLPPTALMGATLPAMARRYSTGRRGMSGLAGLYAANTVGAVLGSLLSAFYLLAFWDVWIATFAAVASNVLVGTYAFRLGGILPRRRDDSPDPHGPAVASALPAPDPYLLRAVYVGAALSGLTALGAQVIWTRLLSLLFGATVYAFAIILAVFLAGLGIGSALAAYLLRRGQNALRGLAWSQLLLVPSLLVGGAVLANLLPFTSMQPLAWTPPNVRNGFHVLRAIDVILPSAVLWGMSFPFALAAAGKGHNDPARSSGNVYAANTIGAIMGSLGISFLAIPQYGTRWASQALAVLVGVSAALLFGAARRQRPELGRRRAWMPSVALVLGLAFLAAAYLPGLSNVFLAHGRYVWWVDTRDQYLYVSEGAASTVAVHAGPDGYRNFHVSGRVEASNNANDLRTERLIGHLSAIPHPKPEKVLVVGMGAGITAGTL